MLIINALSVVARDGIEPPTPAFSGLRVPSSILLKLLITTPQLSSKKPSLSATKCNHGSFGFAQLRSVARKVNRPAF